MKRLKAHIEKHGRNISNHVKKHHKKYLIGGFGIFGVIKMIMLMFSFFAGYQLFHVDKISANRINNDYFLDDNFWFTSPTNEDIISALYGNELDLNTAYTQNWTGYDYNVCLRYMDQTNVVHTGVLPPVLSENTIYVVPSQTDLSISSAVTMSNCSAIVLESASGRAGFKLSKTNNTILINTNNANYIILDGLNFAGSNRGNPGIYVNNSDNWTFNRIESYENNNDVGIKIENSNYGLLNGSQFYSNGVNGSTGDCGVYIGYGSTNNILNNIQSYNNQYCGLYSTGSTTIHNVINNSQFYNNGYIIGYGIELNNDSMLVLNQVSTYSNLMHGLFNNGGDVTTHNFYSFHNGIDGINNVGTSKFVYYDNLFIYDNNSGSNVNGTIITGDNIEYSSLGWGTGNKSYLVPDNADNAVMQVYNATGQIGPWPTKYDRVGSNSGWKLSASGYIYGSLINKQNKPVFYNGENLAISTKLEYNTGKYIGEWFDLDWDAGDTNAPVTIIEGSTSCTSSDIGITLSCDDSTVGGGVGCTNDSPKYTIVPYTDTCTGAINIYTSPFNIVGVDGSYIRKKVCYQSEDDAGNVEILKTSSGFNIDRVGPNAPVLVYPSSGYIVTGSQRPILSWNSVVDSGCSLVYEYKLYVYSDSNCSNLDSSYNVSSPTTGKQTDILTNNSTYYWNVRAFDNLGNTGDYSECRSFSIAVPDITAPYLSSKTPFNTGWYNINQISYFYYNDNVGVFSGSPAMCTITSEGINSTCSINPNVCDVAGNCNTGVQISNSIGLDKTDPVIDLLFPSSGENLNTGNINFVWSGFDNLSNISRYSLYIDDVFTGNTINTGFFITGLDNGSHSWYVIATDNAGNTGISSTGYFDVSLDMVGPNISTGYIYSGNVVFNQYNYYNGIIDIKADVTDVDGISGDTCEYTVNGSNRSKALYSGTNNTGYCYVTGLNADSLFNIIVGFSIEDLNGNRSVSDNKLYLYDNLGPNTGDFNINNNDQYTNTGIVDLIISECPIEEQYGSPARVGLSGMYISNNPNPDSGDSFYECVDGMVITGWALSGDQGINTVYMVGVDKLGNLGDVVSDEIILDTQKPANPVCTPGTSSFGSTINVSCTGNDGTIRYEDNGVDPTCSSLERTGDKIYSNTTTLSVVQCDAAGNMSEINTYTYTYDSYPFTVVLSNEKNYVNHSFVVTGTFSTGTNDFTSGDVTIISGSINNFQTINSGLYTWEVIPDSEGIVTIYIDTGVAINSISRPNDQSNEIVVNYDTTKPQLSGTIQYSPLSGVRTSGTVTATIVLNETGTVIGGESHLFTDNGSYKFQFEDLAGNTGEVTAEVSWIDKEAPTFDFENGSGYECVAGSLTISNRSDGTGAGITTASAYSFDGSNWNSDTSINIVAQQIGVQTVTGWVRDSLGNSSYKTATYTFNDVLPTLTSGNMVFSNIVSPTSGNESIDNILTYLGATEGSCGNTNITGQLVSCTFATESNIVGSSLNIVPNADTEGTGVCTIEFTDNELNVVTGFVTYYVDTKVPVVPVCNPTTTTFAGSIDVSCTGNDGIIRYTTGSATPTCLSEERGDTSFTETTTLKAVQCDDAGNISSVVENIYTLNNDDFIVELTSNVGAYVNHSFVVTGIFITGTNDFNSGKIDITNGTITNFSEISDTVYVWEVNPNSNGNITTVKINSGDVANYIGAKNIESNTISTIYDVTAPVVETGEIIYSPASGSRTSGDVRATLSGYDEEITVTNPSSGVIYYDFTENDAFTFEFEDLAGNTGEVEAEVTWIDKEEPTFSGVTSGAVYSGERTILFEDNGIITISTLSGETIQSGYIVSGTNTYVLYIEDEAGNSTGATFEMDNTAPNLAWTNGVSESEVAFDEVEIDFDDAVYSGYKLVTHTGDCSSTGLSDYTGAITYNETGVNEYYFCAYGRDAVGNESILYSNNKFNINTSAATIQVDDNFSSPVYTGRVTMTGFNIDGDISYKIINDIVDCDNTNGVVYTGQIVFTGESNNEKYVCAYASGLSIGVYVTGLSLPINVDRTAPSLYEKIAVTQTGNDTTPEYTFSSNEAGDIIYGGGCTGNKTQAVSGDNQIEFDELGAGLHDTCTIQVIDEAGNISDLDVSDFYIKLSPDNFTIRDDVSSGVTNSDRIEVIRGEDNVIKKRTYKEDNSCNANNSGYYLYDYTLPFNIVDTGHNGEYICFYAEDALGNKIVGPSINVLNIDITKPTATVIYIPGSGSLTSGNVLAMITLGETGDITNNGGSGNYLFTNNSGFTFEFVDEAGNTGIFLAEVDWIDKDVPVLAVVTGVVQTGSDSTPAYSFTSTKSGEITYGGDCSGNIYQAISGVNDVIFDELDDGIYTNCTIIVTDELGNASDVLNVNTFIIDTQGPVVGFDDIVENVAVGSDRVAVNYDDASVRKYKLINTGDLCNNIDTQNYIGAINYNDDLNNGKYFCIYAEDSLGNISTGISNNALNIDTSAIVFTFDNPVNLSPVQSDTVSVAGTNLIIRQYKLVSNTGDCDQNNMNNYVGEIVYNTETNNNKYFCAYAQDSLGKTGLIISANKLNIDRTNPTYGGVVSGSYYNISVSPTYADLNYVSATLNGNAFNSNDIVSAEGHYDLVISDEAGNTTNVGFDIDKTLPIYSGIEDGGYYNYTVNPTFGDENGVSARLNGNPFNSGDPVSNEGSYTLVIEDIAGNQIVIDFVIDKTIPVLTGIVDIPSPINDIYPELSIGISEPGIISYSGSCSGDLVNGLSGENTIIFGPLNDGLYDDCYIGIKDPAGNTGEWLYVNPFIVKTSCDLPRGGSIASGQSTVAYSTNSVACTEICVSEVRSCDNGILSGSFTNGSCSVGSCNGGGGGYTLRKDDCPDGDNSSSYYDKTCEKEEDEDDKHNSSYIDTCKINDSNYSTELKGAYLYSYENKITSRCPIDDADLYGSVTRIEMAKMISVFVTDVVGLKQDTDKVCDFPDISETLDAQYGNGVTNACQLGLMGIDMINFDPYGLVNRAQFGTVLSRILYGDRHNGYTPYYEKHLAALKTDNIMNNLDDPMMLEKRGYVMLMMQRADNYGLFLGMIPALKGVDALLR